MTIYLFLVRQACLTQYVYCELLAIGRRLCDIPPLNGAVSGARIILLLVLVVLLRRLQLCACAALVVRCPSSALIVCCLLSLCGAVCCAWWLVVFLSAAKFEVYLRWLAAFAFLVYGSRRLVRLLLSWWCGCAFCLCGSFGRCGCSGCLCLAGPGSLHASSASYCGSFAESSLVCLKARWAATRGQTLLLLRRRLLCGCGIVFLSSWLIEVRLA